MTKRRSWHGEDVDSLIKLMEAVRKGRAQIVRHDPRRKVFEVQRGKALEVWSYAR